MQNIVIADDNMTDYSLIALWLVEKIGFCYIEVVSIRAELIHAQIFQ